MACWATASKWNDQWQLSDGFHWTNSVPSFFLADEQNFFRKTFSSSFEFRKFGAISSSKPLSNMKVKLLLLRNLHECVKFSMFIVFEILQPYRWIFSFRTSWPFRCYWGGIVRDFLYFSCKQRTQFVFFTSIFFFLTTKLGFPEKNWQLPD